MAVYKVIQDIEAEDKLLGPLTLKGFVYAAIALGCGFINFRLLFVTALGPGKWALILMFSGPMLLFAVLASPLGREQPTEIWLLSRIRFMLKARKRLWDQNNIKDPVTVTAPKKSDLHLTKDMSQTEVQSRLQSLASTLDSRGWSVKNSNVNISAQPNYLQTTASSDRLVEASTVTDSQDQDVLDIRDEDDILDAQNNPTAQNFQNMMDQAEQDRKTAIANRLEDARHSAKSSTSSPAQPAPQKTSPATLTSEEQGLLQKLHQQDAYLASQHLIIKDGTGTTTDSGTGKIDEAESASGLSIATIAKLAARNSQPGLGDDSLYLH